jgi:hypothetical protein
MSETAYNYCNCGYNDNGSAVCKPFMDDDQGKAYASAFLDFITHDATALCNTARRYNMECWKSHADSVYTKTFLDAYIQYKHLTQLMGNDQCVKDMITDYLQQP